MTLWGTYFSLAQLHRRKRKISHERPPISVLKPLKGADSGLETNLITFFHLDYPDYELLFCVAEESDPAREVAQRLMNRYPNTRAKLFIGESLIGVNPKVNNLMVAYHEAKHDWILISDSNVRVPVNYLNTVTECLEPGVGAVTAVVAGVQGKGIGGKLEVTFLNSFYARWMQIASAFGAPFIVGKSMLFQKSTMERFGGIKNLGRYIAEDYMAGQGIRRLGLRIKIMQEPIYQYIGDYSLKEFWLRHLRWGRIRKSQAPIAFFIEPWLGALVSGGMGAWIVPECFGVSKALFLAIHFGVWFLCDLAILVSFEKKLSLDCLWFWLLREILAFPLWLHIACGSHILWRGNRLQILPGGLVKVRAVA